MYAVSQEYLDKLFSVGVQRRCIEGDIDGIKFTQDDVLMSSLSYDNQCVSGADIKLGGVFIGQLSLTFLRSFSKNIIRGSWKGRIVNVKIGLEIDEGQWEFVPFQPFVIDDANHNGVGVEITAYDYMSKFDKAYGGSTTTGNLYDMAVLACLNCGVELGLTEAEMKSLPNATDVLSVYPNNDMETWRDLISWIAVTVGGFATIDRTGKLVFKTFHRDVNLEINQYSRFAGGSWSDFETYFTGISIVNIEDETTTYYGMDVDDGLSMAIGSNPLMQYGTSDVKTRQRRALLESLQGFRYVPFNSSSFIDPCLDLGDVIRYTGGLADDDCISCVMSIQYGYQSGMKLAGYGKNPALFGAQSKTDKNISGLLSKNTENEIITHTFVNSQSIDLGEDEETQVVLMRFTTLKSDVTVNVWHEIMLDVTPNEEGGVVTCQAFYYLNDVLEAYSPVTTWDNEGYHLLHLLYFLTDLLAGTAFKWQVKLKITGGTATIAVNEAHALLQAQGLVGIEAWDGTIELEDTFSLALHRDFAVRFRDGEVHFSQQVPSEITGLADTFILGMHRDFGVSFTDDPADILMRQNVYRRVTEDGNVRVTEEGNIRMTEGGSN